MLALYQTLELNARIANHQSAANFKLRRHANQIKQRLVSCNAAGLYKPCNRCAKPNRRCKKFCVSPYLFSVAHAGAVKAFGGCKHKARRIARDNVLAAVVVRAR